jgi:hypothetical protein
VDSARTLVVPASVDRDLKEPLEFLFTKYSITVMSFEIETADAPNWFGVSFRRDIRAFTSVNIFCHPNPGAAGMTDDDYPTRSKLWPRLFRYSEMLGSQIDAAGSNQIVIVPFFNNASYENTGIFGSNWRDIVDQILAAVSASIQVAAAKKALTDNIGLIQPSKSKAAVAKAGVASAATAATPIDYTAALQHVVLSGFSRGRGLMWTVRQKAAGIQRHLREVWDFDGVGAAPPFSSGNVRGILYDRRNDAHDARSFHVPPERWIAFHKRVVRSVHSNIPDMLAWHAASISGVK